MGGPRPGGAGELGEEIGCLDLRRDALEAPDEHGELLAHRGRRGRLPVRAGEHRGIPVLLREGPQRVDDRAQGGQPHVVHRAPDRERVGRGVDVLTRAGEVGELGDPAQPEPLQPIAHEVLDRLHIVPGDGLLGGEPLDLLLPEVEVERAQPTLRGLAQRRRAEQGSVGQRDQPLDLHLDAGAVQPGLGEMVGERRRGRAVASVEGAERLRGK